MKQLLKQGGASREFFVSNLATHIVASNTDFPEYHQAKDSGIVVVKVTRTVIASGDVSFASKTKA